ncbi:MAG: penicillin-binding transpeptidase domain-containing protein [Bacillota bacterium]
MTFSRKLLQKKLLIFLYTTVIIFLILVFRLFYLQVVQAHVYRTQSEENRIRIISKEARRGDIISADNKVLATSMPVFTVSISHISNKEKQQQAIVNLVEILDDPEITEELIKEKLQKHVRKFEPVEIVTLPWDEKGIEIISRLEERRTDVPGVVIEEVPQRYYPMGELAGHILGYVGKISPRELEIFSQYQYGINDKLGKTGIERVAEIKDIDGNAIGLRGKKGVQQVEVNASNRPIRELVNIPSTPGNNVKLTLNVDLQNVLEQSLDDVIEMVKEENPKAGSGGAVVLDVKTGAILAIASKPDMNPNDFVDGSFVQKQDYYNDSVLKPEFNRVVRGTYPPGSTFKMITLMAALETNSVELRDTVVCSGAYWRPPFIKCVGVHGTVDFHRALAVSCNTYVQNAAHLTGINEIIRVAEQFGLGRKTGTPDLLGEEAGILPTPEWKKELNAVLVQRKFERRKDEIEKKYQTLRGEAKTVEEFQELDRLKDRELALAESQFRIEYNFETNWHPFDTYNTSIGQGSNNFTILQLANYTATLANGGNRYVPYLIDKIVTPQGEVLVDYQPLLAGTVDISPRTMQEVITGMHHVTRPGGTAYVLFSSFPDHIKVAAKTGTAQTGRVGDDRNKDFHGVFVAFAPIDDPQIAFAGLIEYARTGGGSAGRVAKAVFEEYFGLNKTELDEENINWDEVE